MKIKLFILILAFIFTPKLYSQVSDSREPVFGYPDAGRVCRVYKHYGFKFRGKYVTLFKKREYSAADKKRIKAARKQKHKR